MDGGAEAKTVGNIQTLLGAITETTGQTFKFNKWSKHINENKCVMIQRDLKQSFVF